MAHGVSHLFVGWLIHGSSFLHTQQYHLQGNFSHFTLEEVNQQWQKLVVCV